MTRAVSPPHGGQPPPDEAVSQDGTKVALRPLAEEICRRYRQEFPDEEKRYGDAGMAWCVHDNQHILNWAYLDQRGVLSLGEQVAWLGRVLHARGFPLERLARDLEIAAEVVGDDEIASRLRTTAATVMDR